MACRGRPPRQPGPSCRHRRRRLDRTWSELVHRRRRHHRRPPPSTAAARRPWASHARSPVRRGYTDPVVQTKGVQKRSQKVAAAAAAGLDGRLEWRDTSAAWWRWRELRPAAGRRSGARPPFSAVSGRRTGRPGDRSDRTRAPWRAPAVVGCARQPKARLIASMCKDPENVSRPGADRKDLDSGSVWIIQMYIDPPNSLPTVPLRSLAYEGPIRSTTYLLPGYQRHHQTITIRAPSAFDDIIDPPGAPPAWQGHYQLIRGTADLSRAPQVCQGYHRGLSEAPISPSGHYGPITKHVCRYLGFGQGGGFQGPKVTYTKNPKSPRIWSTIFREGPHFV